MSYLVYMLVSPDIIAKDWSMQEHGTVCKIRHSLAVEVYLGEHSNLIKHQKDKKQIRDVHCDLYIWNKVKV